jgi:hypothetical protein
MALYMGVTKYGDRRHLIDIYIGFETKALCGSRITEFVVNSHTDNPVPYADHWYDSICEHCAGMLRSHRGT